MTFRGVLTGREKLAAYARADVLCFPTFFESETFGLVLLEAMSFGLPVVATRWRGIPSIVDDGVTGFLAGVRDPDAVAERLLRLARDPALRERIGAAARRKFLREYTIDRHLARMAAMFREVAGVEKARRGEGEKGRWGKGLAEAAASPPHPFSPSPLLPFSPSPRLLGPRYLVTGGSGFIGTNLVENLRGKGSLA